MRHRAARSIKVSAVDVDHFRSVGESSGLNSHSLTWVGLAWPDLVWSGFCWGRHDLGWVSAVAVVQWNSDGLRFQGRFVFVNDVAKRREISEVVY